MTDLVLPLAGVVLIFGGGFAIGWQLGRALTGYMLGVRR